MIDVAELQRQGKTIWRIVTAHKCTSPRVFGSVVAGTNTADSDVDLLVDELPDATLLDIARLELALQQEFGVRFDVNTPLSLPRAWRQSVLDGAIPL